MFDYGCTSANKIIIMIINQWENHARSAALGLIWRLAAALSRQPRVYQRLKIVYIYFKHATQVTERSTSVAGGFWRPVTTETSDYGHINLLSRCYCLANICLSVHSSPGIVVIYTFATEGNHHYKHILIIKTVAWKSL